MAVSKWFSDYSAKKAIFVANLPPMLPGHAKVASNMYTTNTENMHNGGHKRYCGQSKYL